jgi:hypothetical protein
MRIGNVLLRCVEQDGARNILIDVESPGPVELDIAKAVGWAMEATRWMHGLGARHFCDAWIETGKGAGNA